MLMDRFDPSKYPDTDNLPLKNGNYDAKITSIQLRDAKSGDGNMIVVEMEVQGRRVLDWLLREHSNEKAVEIASRKLASLCRAAEVVVLTNSDQLVGAVVEVKLTVDGDFNKVRSYYRIGRSTTPNNDIANDDLPF